VKVVNRHCHKGPWPAHSFYIGRPGGGAAAREISRGAVDATLFGNPFTLQEHGEDALGLYKRWLWDKLQEDPGYKAALRALPPDAVLVCSCKPRDCHGDVIIAAWTSWKDSGRALDEWIQQAQRGQRE